MSGSPKPGIQKTPPRFPLYGDLAKLDPDFKNQIATGIIDFVSPTPDTDSLTMEITKGIETEPVLKKTVNTSKGAIIPIESPTP